MAPLFDLVLKHVPPPKVEDGPFRMLGTLLEANPYPRPHRHRPHLRPARSSRTRPSRCSTARASSSRPGRVSKILAFRGIERQPIDEAEAGDIVAIAGLEDSTSPTRSARPRTTSRCRRSRSIRRRCRMTFLVNDSPLAGTEGDKVTSRVIRDRLSRRPKAMSR